MAQNTSLEGLRSQIITQIFGRRLGLDVSNALAGPVAMRNQVDGVTSGTTIVSTSVATPIPAYGVTMVGATGASGTTAYILAAPIPGVRKTLFCPTTGYAVVIATTISTGAGTAGAFLVSTASVTSTHQTMTFAGKGNNVELIGLTTNLWGVLGNQVITSLTTGPLVQFS